MEQHVFSRRRVAGGLTCAAAGAMALVLTVGSPAGATEGPEIETGPGWSVDELSDRFGGQWAEAEVPMETGRHLLDDGGTPDASDDAYVDLQVENGEVSWSSDGVEIGAVEVPGGGENQLFTYGGGHGSRHGEFEWGGGHGGRDRGWGGHGGGRGFRFCWKKGGGEHPPPPTHPPMTPPPTHPPTTAPPTTAPPTTAPPTSTPPEFTTTTTAPPTSTTLPQTEATTPTTQPAGEQLPRTGSSTMPLVVGALALLGLGAAAFFGRRYLQQRV